MTEAPKRYGRTNKVPFAQTTHPLYPYDDQNGPSGGRLDQTMGDRSIQTDRYDRHGWGDTSLLKEEGYSGIDHPHAQQPLRQGKGIPAQLIGLDGRADLFGVLQMTEKGEKDSWIGNKLIDPAKGKRPTRLPPDPKGRQDLFDVLHARRPGVPSDDSWMGNRLVDPSKGKGSAPGPEQLRGRPDLSDVFNQSILREPELRRFELLRKGGDTLSDGWVGNKLVHPDHGKAPVSGVHATEVKLLGATFKGGAPEGHSDFPRRHQKAVDPPACDHNLGDVLSGTAGSAQDWGKYSKRVLPEPHGRTSVPERKDHLYAHMTYKPLSQVESTAMGRAFDDGKITARGRPAVLPGSEGPGKGIDMLHWKADTRIGNFVRYGGLAQEGRVIRSS